MKFYSTIAVTSSLLALSISVASAQAANPHRLIIPRITRGDVLCRRIYSNLPIQGHRQFLYSNCKKWGLGKVVDLATNDKPKEEKDPPEHRGCSAQPGTRGTCPR